MSRQIPQDRTLSDEDRTYLVSRGHVSQVAYLDQEFPPDPDALAAYEARMRGEQPATGDLAVVTNLQARVAQLEAYIVEDLGASLPLAPGEETDEDDDRPYEEWTLSELQAEAGSRQLSKSGTKADLAARLQEHDDAQ